MWGSACRVVFSQAMGSRAFGVLWLVVFIVGCGDDAASPTDAGTARDAGDAGGDGTTIRPAECSDGMATFEGMIGDRAIARSEPITSRSLVQIEPPFVYELGFGTMGRMVVELPAAAVPGARMSATGRLELPGEAPLCIALDMAVDVEGFDRFEITELSTADGETCPGGVSVAGVIAACADAS
jgi:hypothetical protein